MKKLIPLLIIFSTSFCFSQSFWKHYLPEYGLGAQSVLTPDYGLIMNSTGLDSGFYLGHLWRIDSTGTVIWSKQEYLTADTSSVTFTNVINTQDGNYLTFGYGYTLHKFDINGNTIWSKLIHEENYLN